MTIHSFLRSRDLKKTRFCNENGNMIRGTIAVVLAIILLIISVSGFFILLVSDSNNIFFPTIHSTFQLRPEFSSESNTFIQHITLCQLALLVAEVICSLVIIFSNYEYSNPANYNIVPITSRREVKKFSSSPNCQTNKCNFMFSLKLTFIFLMSFSFLLRLITSTWSSLISIAPPNQLPTLAYLSSALIAGASNFSGIIYVTSILEVLLFFTVISTSSQISSRQRVALASDNRWIFLKFKRFFYLFKCFI